ncbi:hypothetical protein P1P68_40480 [Streptomyces scabiei]|uniref:hypothetical protein n=1 Tax=Streptomyces scabiei TaxID=1930 RepID=UPI0029901C13|nr:hypothetical protein [Streptomyces scabiei]MDW8810915.1 hypothetical protein [Streptomyces scabiei]
MEQLDHGESTGSHPLLDADRVPYGVGVPKFDQKRELWTPEAGDRRYDDCRVLSQRGHTNEPRPDFPGRGSFLQGE